MTDKAGKGGKRKSPMEGFNNVPKILEEARRMVDAVTQAGPDDAVKTTTPVGPEDQITQPAPVEIKTKPKKPSLKKTPTQAAQEDRAAAGKKPKARAAASAPVSEGAPEPRPLEVPLAPKQALSPEKLGIHIVHRVPGRTRLKLRQMKYNAALAKSLEERLAIVPGITGVETSTITASAIFYYNPKELCQRSALVALEDAWQDLFPRMQTEKLITAMTCQRPK